MCVFRCLVCDAFVNLPFGKSLHMVKRRGRNQKSTHDVNAREPWSLMSYASTEPQPLCRWENGPVSQDNSTLRSGRVLEGLKRRI